MIGQIAVENGLIVNWQRDDVTPDLAGYQIEYTYPDWDGNALNRVRRITRIAAQVIAVRTRALRRIAAAVHDHRVACAPTMPAATSAAACHSTSPCLKAPMQRLGRPTGVVALAHGDGSISINWNAPSSGSVTGYLLSYGPTGCQRPGASSLADQGPSPIDVRRAHAQLHSHRSDDRTAVQHHGAGRRHQQRCERRCSEQSDDHRSD